MLKRHQVLLDDWLVKHLQDIAKKYDVSFSETIRWALCMHVQRAVSLVHSKRKAKAQEFEKRLADIIKKRNLKNDLDEEKIHRLLSDLYYETRKIIEFWEGKEGKRKK